MSMSTSNTQSAVVVALELTPTHPSRHQAIQAHHLQQVIADDQAMCLVGTKLMPTGQIVSDLVCVEPAQAAILVRHIYDVLLPELYSRMASVDATQQVRSA